MSKPSLKWLHPESSLSPAKIDRFNKVPTEVLIESLQPGRQGSLKVRPDGTVLDGHHRLRVLCDRGIDIEALPREIVPRDISTS